METDRKLVPIRHPVAPHMPTSTRLVVLISGGGTTLQNVLDVTASGGLAATVVGVVSSRANVGGVGRAERAGVPVSVVGRGDGFSERVFEAIRGYRPDLVLMAGWLHLLRIPVDFAGRVMNIHPSLLPAFGGQGMYGRRVHEAALQAGVKVSGCTVHYADDAYDTGPIIVQRAVPVEDDDTPETLAARVFAAECVAYPEAVRLWASGRLRIVGRRVVSGGRHPPESDTSTLGT